MLSQNCNVNVQFVYLKLLIVNRQQWKMVPNVKKMHITSSLFKCGYKNIHYVLHMTVKNLGHAACKFIV